MREREKSVCMCVSVRESQVWNAGRNEFGSAHIEVEVAEGLCVGYLEGSQHKGR